MKQCIKLLNKFYKIRDNFNFGGGEWEKVIVLFNSRHCYTHPRELKDLDTNVNILVDAIKSLETAMYNIADRVSILEREYFKLIEKV